MRTDSERVTIDVGGQKMGGYLARPLPDDPRPFPAVLVFMEIFGINSHIRSVVDRIAAEGYVALAPDVYHRTAPGMDHGYDPESRQKGMSLIGQLRSGEVLDDTRAAIAYLRGRSDVRGDRLGTIGFCIGGHLAYLVASTGEMRATASFYGGGITQFGLGDAQPTVSRTPGIKGKILLFFGGEDQSIPETQVETIKKALYDAGTRAETFVYPTANHAFFCDQRGGYQQMAAEDSWKKVKKMFLDELHGA